MLNLSLLIGCLPGSQISDVGSFKNITLTKYKADVMFTVVNQCDWLATVCQARPKSLQF